MSIDVFAICWNEAFLLPHFFRHYSFASNITIYDNGSTDGSQDLIRKMGGKLRTYDTNGQQDNAAMLQVKNKCWEDSDADWVIVCDIDEFVFGCDKLRYYSTRWTPAPVFLCESYQMISESPPDDFCTITRGFRSSYFDKCLCFSPEVSAMNYTPGCHQCSPSGGAIIPEVLKLGHYNMLGEDYVVNRWKRYVPRMSQSDIDNQWGNHYLHPEESIRAMWQKSWRESHEVHSILYA